MTGYGLAPGTNIPYGGPGFPQWVYDMAKHWGLSASTYPGHQESDRLESGYARNPGRLNRGIDWSGPTDAMHRFALYCLSIRQEFEQVIWQHPNTGQKIGVAGGDDVSATAYFASEYAQHRDHVHTRQSKPIPLPDAAAVVQPVKENKPVGGWTGDPVWLADVLRAQKPALKVRELPDWQQFGHGDYKQLWGVMIHHTGNARETAESIRRGRPDLPGPLSNLHIAPDGTVTVVAGGVCWHAGRGSYVGIPRDMANWHLIGIECAWPMDTTITPATQNRERWPDEQIIAMRDTVAAILTRLGVGANRVIAHKEWAGAAQGKWDPGNLSPQWFRGEVAKAMRGEFANQKPQPPTTPGTVYPQDLTDRQLLESIWRKIDGLAAMIGTQK